MPSLRRFSFVVLPLVLFSGCRKSAASGSHEALVKEAIVSARNTASSLNSVADAASAEQAVNVLQREAQNLQTLRQRQAELGRASSSERDRVKQHSQDVIASSKAMVQASSSVAEKIKGNHFPPELAKRIATASQEYGKAMTDFWTQTKPLFD